MNEKENIYFKPILSQEPWRIGTIHYTDGDIVCIQTEDNIPSLPSLPMPFSSSKEKPKQEKFIQNHLFHKNEVNILPRTRV